MLAVVVLSRSIHHTVLFKSWLGKVPPLLMNSVMSNSHCHRHAASGTGTHPQGGIMKPLRSRATHNICLQFTRTEGKETLISCPTNAVPAGPDPPSQHQPRPPTCQLVVRHAHVCGVCHVLNEVVGGVGQVAEVPGPGQQPGGRQLLRIGKMGLRRIPLTQ